jgi:hypothetical protein
VADSSKLAQNGSALKQSIGGKGYGPGVQAWYNQSLAVDPTTRSTSTCGLEEVYETWDGGTSWKAVGPYWNFYFPCWSEKVEGSGRGQPRYNTCPRRPTPTSTTRCSAERTGLRERRRRRLQPSANSKAVNATATRRTGPAGTPRSARSSTTPPRPARTRTAA